MRANAPDREPHRPERAARPTPSAAPLDVPLTGGPAQLLALQRSIGNAAVSRLIEESRHTHGDGCGHDAPAVQRSAVHETLRGSGRRLEAPVRAEMEARLGADFSDVRVHTGASAQRSAAEIGARAYTSGNHVVIGDGGADRHTLAHELTHVIQQRQGPVAGTDNGSGLRVSDPSDRFEREAETNARQALSGQYAPPAPSGHQSATAGPAQQLGAPIQRFLDPNADGHGWQQAAKDYIRANTQRILTSYVSTTVGGKQSRATAIKVFNGLLHVDDTWGALFTDGEGMFTAIGQAGRPDGKVADSQLQALVRCLNIMEEEIATSGKSAETNYATPLADVLVGTEFTFSDGVLNGTADPTKPPLRVDLTGLKGTALADARRVVTHAENKMAAWAAAVQAAPMPTGLTVAVTDVAVKGQPAKRFTYTSNDGFQWWWEITMDDACLETRTDPKSVGALSGKTDSIGRIIPQHIFGLATSSAVNLAIDTSVFGGGGHISMDARSAFGGSVELFVESVRAWEAQWAAWKSRFGDGTRGQADTENAPWTGDLEDGHQLLANLDTVLDEIRDAALAGKLDLLGAVQRLKAHMQGLPLHADASQNLRDKVATHPADRLHYQAVNLEHMGTGTPDAEQRVEFRDIQAQRDYQDLVNDLIFICTLVQGVRAEINVRQRTRLSTRHP